MTAMIHNIRPAAVNETSEFNAEQDTAIRLLASSLHRLNQAVERAVEAGITVELIRASRHHDARGNWGDQLVPMIRRHD